MSHGWEGGSAGSYGEYMKSRAEGAGAGRSHLEKLIAAAAEEASVAAAADPAISTVPKRVALIGDAFVDFNLSGLQRLPAWGTDVPCAGVRMLPGGSCANTARQLGSLGGSSIAASFFGAVGDDDLGRFFIRALSEEGHVVGAESTLHRLAGVPQSCCTILAGPSDRAMISCYTSNERLTIEPFAAALAGSDGCEPWALFHLGGYFNTVGTHTSAMLDTLRDMKARGTILTMDPQHDANGKWTGEDGHLSKLFPLLDVFLPNEVEIAHVAAHCSDEPAAGAGTGELEPVGESAVSGSRQLPTPEALPRSGRLRPRPLFEAH